MTVRLASAVPALALLVAAAGASPALAAHHRHAEHHRTERHRQSSARHHATAKHGKAASAKHEKASRGKKGHTATAAPAAPKGVTNIPGGGMKLYCGPGKNPLLVRKMTQGAGTTVTVICR